MIEPTETESKETLDAVSHSLHEIFRTAYDSPEMLLAAPHGAPIRRPDEVRAARTPVLKY